MENNTWTPIWGYEDRYLINREGAVRSIERRIIDSAGRKKIVISRVLQQFIDRAGYWTVALSKDKKRGTQFVHRLLALTFLENPVNKPMVNHKNGNKTDNWLGNLEWVTRSENQIHALKIGLCKSPGKNSRPVRSRCTGKIYKSMFAASLDENIPYEKIKYLLKHRVGTCLEFAA